MVNIKVLQNFYLLIISILLSVILELLF